MDKSHEFLMKGQQPNKVDKECQHYRTIGTTITIYASTATSLDLKVLNNNNLIKEKKKNLTIFEPIDEIDISSKERVKNIVQQIEENEISSKERAENIVEQIDEIDISAKERAENMVEVVILLLFYYLFIN